MKWRLKAILDNDGMAESFPNFGGFQGSKYIIHEQKMRITALNQQSRPRVGRFKYRGSFCHGSMISHKTRVLIFVPSLDLQVDVQRNRSVSLIDCLS